MEIRELKKRSDTGADEKLTSKIADLEKLIEELRKKSIPPIISGLIDQRIDAINTFTGSNRDLVRLLKKTQISILILVERELKLVPQKHFLKRWLAIGMCLGIPLGVALGVSLKNGAFAGIGLPIGMGIGMAMGSSMDKKAFKQGRQLGLEIK